MLFTGSANGQKGQNLIRKKGPSPKGQKSKGQKVTLNIKRFQGKSKGQQVKRLLKRSNGSKVSQKVYRTKGQYAKGESKDQKVPRSVKRPIKPLKVEWHKKLPIHDCVHMTPHI